MKCRYCEEKATRKVVWADGRARINVCLPHVKKAKDVIEKRGKDHVTSIVRI